MAKFIRFPFGTSGDRTAVPDTADPGGAVSYTQGFGPDYELELGVDPGAKPVPRPETNQLHFDSTDNIRQYQLNGAPEWYPASENGGVAISYPINSIVRHGDLVYRSLVATNTVEPGTDPAQWAVDGVAVLATTAVSGLVRYATSPETIARTVADRAVTPAGLGALIAALLNAPIFPEVLGATGLFTLTSPANNVRIAAGTQWVHRGVEKYTSVQTDLATVASKTYHLRWTPVGGFALMDLSNGGYNPSAVPEGDVTFDSTYDDMLIARVVTSAGNVATILPLVNKNSLMTSVRVSGTPSYPGGGNLTWSASTSPNWARTPRIYTVTGAVQADMNPGGNMDHFANWVDQIAVSRYGTAGRVTTDWEASAIYTSSAAYLDFSLVA